MLSKCQVFTPQRKVCELLDEVGYVSNLRGKRIIENACGDGKILIEIVKRYIEDSLSRKENTENLKFGLENDIFGVEIDIEQHAKCLINLDRMANIYGIQNVKWNILNCDFLKMSEEISFDYVVGNPPYITYRDLDMRNRSYLKAKFKSCKYGKFDYCYAFIEASINCLTCDGKLAYLVPNSIFKNVFAKELRNIVLPYITKIIDYSTQKVFEKALISSAIIVCYKGNTAKDFIYYDVVNDAIRNLSKLSLGDKWVFSNYFENGSKKQRFGDYFSSAICVATLLNKAFILKSFTVEEKFINVGKFKIEMELVKDGVSPRSLFLNRKELIVFPYSYYEGKLIRYSEHVINDSFPEARKYLDSFKKELKNRKADKNVLWFEFGRTQALSHLNKPKLLLSTIVTNRVKVYELSEYCIPYSGIYITSCSGVSLKKAIDILESDDFFQYVKGIGISANGNSIRITPSDISNYNF